MPDISSNWFHLSQKNTGILPCFFKQRRLIFHKTSCLVNRPSILQKSLENHPGTPNPEKGVTSSQLSPWSVTRTHHTISFYTSAGDLRVFQAFLDFISECVSNGSQKTLGTRNQFTQAGRIELEMSEKLPPPGLKELEIHIVLTLNPLMEGILKETIGAGHPLINGILGRLC